MCHIKNSKLSIYRFRKLSVFAAQASMSLASYRKKGQIKTKQAFFLFCTSLVSLVFVAVLFLFLLFVRKSQYLILLYYYRRTTTLRKEEHKNQAWRWDISTVAPLMINFLLQVLAEVKFNNQEYIITHFLENKQLVVDI